jgi:hypothetical protein
MADGERLPANCGLSQTIGCSCKLLAEPCQSLSHGGELGWACSTTKQLDIWPCIPRTRFARMLVSLPGGSKISETSDRQPLADPDIMSTSVRHAFFPLPQIQAAFELRSTLLVDHSGSQTVDVDPSRVWTICIGRRGWSSEGLVIPKCPEPHMVVAFERSSPWTEIKISRHASYGFMRM